MDEIKIDRCFVKDIQNSRYDYRLLSSMLELVAGSDIQVCCEGVEKKEELHLLETLSPDLLQGYFFSKPCEPEQIEKLYFSAEEVKNQKSRSLCRAAAE